MTALSPLQSRRPSRWARRRKQNAFSDEIAGLGLQKIVARELDVAQVSAALMGACAIVLATLPEDQREMAAEALTGSLLNHAKPQSNGVSPRSSSPSPTPGRKGDDDQTTVRLV